MSTLEIYITEAEIKEAQEFLASYQTQPDYCVILFNAALSGNLSVVKYLCVCGVVLNEDQLGTLNFQDEKGEYVLFNEVCDFFDHVNNEERVNNPNKVLSLVLVGADPYLRSGRKKTHTRAYDIIDAHNCISESFVESEWARIMKRLVEAIKVQAVTLIIPANMHISFSDKKIKQGTYQVLELGNN